ncbi:unnamed protein product [Linum trigynum]|uniref:Uncharacterized protein n=1 Tax=Linum trigynum TaxID=586398 RepID=A0AAV2DLB0_9ROSI
MVDPARLVSINEIVSEAASFHGHQWNVCKGCFPGEALQGFRKMLMKKVSLFSCSSFVHQTVLLRSLEVANQHKREDKDQNVVPIPLWHLIRM